MRHLETTDELMVHGAPSASGGASDLARHAWFDHTEMMLVSSNRDDPVIDSYLQTHQAQGFLHGYTIVLDAGRQHNVRGGRELTATEREAGRVETSLGPISQAVIEPWARWRFELEQTPDSEISVWAECLPATDATLWPRMQHPINDGTHFHTSQDVLLQLIRVERGVLQVGSRTWDLAGWHGFRDHCWGFRLPQVEGGPSAHTWLPAFFPTRKMLLMHREDTARRSMYSFAQIFSDSKSEEFSEVSMEFMAEPGSTVPGRVRWHIPSPQGPSHVLQTGPIEFQHATFIGGGWMGESPDDYYGPFKITSDAWDVKERTRIAAIPGIRGMARHRVEFTLDGEIGYGLLAAFMANDYQPLPVA